MNWRIVSNIPNRVRPPERVTVTNDLRTNESSRSNIVYSSNPPFTAVTDTTSNPPAKTAHAPNTVCSSIVSRSYDHCTA